MSSTVTDAFGAFGAVAGGVGKAVGAFGDDSETTGLELPPELEIQFIDQTQADLTQLNQDLQRVNELETALSERIGTLEGLVAQTIPPSEGLAQLRDSSLRIAQSIGASAEELISQGFLDQDDIDDLQQLEALEAQDFQDPRLENQITDERARLEQDLARQGASPAVRAQALAQFDRRAEESRFTRAEELRTGQFGRISSRIGLRSGLRQTGFQRALGSQAAVQGEIGLAREGIQGLGALAQARFVGGVQAGKQRQQLIGQRQKTFQNLGQFAFSGRTQGLLAQGALGPGSVARQVGPRIQQNQTGITQGNLGGLRQQQLEEKTRQFSRLDNNALQLRLGELSKGSSNFEELRALIREADRRGF